VTVPLTDNAKEDDMDWLEKVWMEVQDEIEYENKYPQPTWAYEDDDWSGTSMYPVDAPK
jgi:hypothetical protein